MYKFSIKLKSNNLFDFSLSENLYMYIPFYTVLYGSLKTSPVELPYIFCKNLSDFTSKALEDIALFLQVSWKILEENA